MGIDREAESDFAVHKAISDEVAPAAASPAPRTSIPQLRPKTSHTASFPAAAGSCSPAPSEGVTLPVTGAHGMRAGACPAPSRPGSCSARCVRGAVLCLALPRQGDPLDSDDDGCPSSLRSRSRTATRRSGRPPHPPPSSGTSCCASAPLSRSRACQVRGATTARGPCPLPYTPLSYTFGGTISTGPLLVPRTAAADRVDFVTS